MLTIYQRSYKGVKAAGATAEAAEASTASGSRVKAGKGNATPQDEKVVGTLENMINTRGLSQMMLLGWLDS